jgi:hypothetical protein
MLKSSSLADALATFADAVRSAYRNLPPGAQEEAQLIAPVQNFLVAAVQHLSLPAEVFAEVAIPDQGRPDLGVTRQGSLTGFIELKAPGKGARPNRFRGHDAQQWKQFRFLPNLIYTDGSEWALYHSGELSGPIIQLGALLTDGSRGLDRTAVTMLANLLRDFLHWEPPSPANSRQLANLLAPLTHFLREQVLGAANREGSNLAQLAQEWREVLFPDADDAQFADGYAQTVTYALLLARVETVGSLDLQQAITILSLRHALLGKALELLSVPQARAEIGTGLTVLERVITSVDPQALTLGERDPWLYFYEDFLAAYDRKLRNDRGVYYTPAEIIQAQCHLTEELLEKRLGKRLGLADASVTLLDPGCGTGAYLVAALDHGIKRVKDEEGEGNVPARATQMGANFHGFEVLVGPYTVAHLRLTQELLSAGAELPSDGVHVYLTDTLESPHARPKQSSMLTRPLTEEHRRALKVKRDTPVLVCLGNPPYNRQNIDANDEATERKGGWIRWGDNPRHPVGGHKIPSEDAILETFLRLGRNSGQGVHLKNLYNDYVYFWRWALWKVFEQTEGPGIVTFITASSYLRGPGFTGMREHMRRVADAIWILDLEGGSLGARRTENVFAIQTPVAIAIVARFGTTDPETPAVVQYTRLEGSREEKLAALGAIRRFSDLSWSVCYAGWHLPFLPEGQGDYYSWPRLTDLFPWQHSGVQFKRTWPIAETEELLERRWRTLVAIPFEEKRKIFRETGARNVDGQYRGIGGERLPSLASLVADEPPPRISRYAFRSFDRQWALLDPRIADRLRPDLVSSHSAHQLYLTSLFTSALGFGPAAVVAADLPDLHHFRGSFGGKDIIPLWRDANAREPNITDGILPLLGQVYGEPVLPEDLFAYAYAVLASSAYTMRFNSELIEPGPRLPLTRDVCLFRQSVELGRRLVAHHTFGRLWAPAEWKGHVPRGEARITRPIPGTPEGYPETFRYDSVNRRLHVGEGMFEPVVPEIWNFTVSGYEVVKSWLGYRKKEGAGRASSQLDELRPQVWTAEMTGELLELLWVLEATVGLFPALEANLDSIIQSKLFHTQELPQPSADLRSSVQPKASDTPVSLTLDFD